MQKKLWAAIKLLFQSITWAQLVFGGTALTLGISLFGWLGSKTTWISSNGPYAISLAACAGGAIIFVLILIAFQARLAWIKGNSLSVWQKQVTNINPLAEEFNRQRIKIDHLANPITLLVRNKRFLDCELMGPAIFVFGSHTTVNNCTFHNCDFIIAHKDARSQNAAVFESCIFLGSTFYHATIIIPPQFAHMFEQGGQLNVIADGRLGDTVSAEEAAQ